MLTVVVLTYNSENSLAACLDSLTRQTTPPAEVIVVDDASTDATAAVVQQAAEADERITHLRSPRPGGFGFAVRAGLDVYDGDAVAIVMGDGSDSPRDLVRYCELLDEGGFDCAFGSRFLPGGSVVDYPRAKLVINRAVNFGIRVLFGHHYDDTTNAFKAYRREVIDSVQPLVSNHFNLTVELPLKAIVRGHSYAVVPITWTNRTAGESKLGLQEMGSRYLFIVLMVFLEHHLARGDYHRPDYRDQRPGLRGELRRRREEAKRTTVP